MRLKAGFRSEYQILRAVIGGAELKELKPLNSATNEMLPASEGNVKTSATKTNGAGLKILAVTGGAFPDMRSEWEHESPLSFPSDRPGASL